MTDGTDLTRAEARASAAKQRLTDTLGILQGRLDPRSRAREAIEDIAGKGARAVDAGVDVAKRNPGKIVGAVAVVAALLGRKRIGALFGRAKAKDDTPKKPAPPRRVRPERPRPAPARRKSE